MSTDRSAQIAELRAGLSRPQKELPSKLFYDQRGSELFEEITRQPEYYLTRTEEALLGRHAPEWVEALQPRALIELGAGSAAKTRVILDAIRAVRTSATYVPVDISAEFLEQTASGLRREYPGLQVVPVAADFTRSFALPPSLPHPALLTFLGSTIGNFTSEASAVLLARVRAAMQPNDRFLLGVDVRKDIAVLEAAYNDARGVTAEFNLNLLQVLNREFDADFEPDAFRHRAIYEPREHRIEMHLESTRSQTIRIPEVATFQLRPGETIRTEISRKYDRESTTQMLASAGLRLLEWVTDDDDRFALSLIAQDPRSAEPGTSSGSHSGT